ncbi:3543_t:CDS:2 [Funneliformis caledonium]|uniref:3543_t:CDS:1 n=1 Tax=Funneliformis caledonium TaxID=1117310 RepID=A0A9N8V938_9GLOM|nr:3543_t:CDS:2 [Funneliformis caledonium]
MTTYEEIKEREQMAVGEYRKAEKKLEEWEKGENDGELLKRLRIKAISGELSEGEKEERKYLIEEEKRLKKNLDDRLKQVEELQKALVGFDKEGKRGHDDETETGYKKVKLDEESPERIVKLIANSNDKRYNPLCALQSAPGGGKSFFLDELAALKSNDLNGFFQQENYKNDEAKTFRGILENSIPICITYNSGSSSDYEYADKEPVRGLALRILWSYFFDAQKLSWN